MSDVIDVTGKTCNLKSGFRRRVCGETAVGLCQYCGRTFCRDHGVTQADAQQVCSRKVCAAKLADLAVHLEYRAAAEARNEAGACGFEGCRAPIANQCIRCQVFYCLNHAFGQEETLLDHNVRVRRIASLCRHCAARRSIWSRL